MTALVALQEYCLQGDVGEDRYGASGATDPSTYHQDMTFGGQAGHEIGLGGDESSIDEKADDHLDDEPTAARSTRTKRDLIVTKKRDVAPGCLAVVETRKRAKTERIVDVVL